MDPARMHRAMRLEYLHGRMHDAAQLALQVVDMADEVSADARRLAARLDGLAWRVHRTGA